MQAIDWLKVMWSPILPHSSEQLHELLGYDAPLFGRQYTESVADARGEHLVLRYDGSAGKRSLASRGTNSGGVGGGGRRCSPPSALFVKLEDEE